MANINIKALLPPSFDWGDQKRSASLIAVYDGIVAKIDDCIHWYQTKRTFKRVLAWWFRILAVILATCATILPTLSEINGRDGLPEDWYFRPGLATILGILAGFFIMLDRLIGASSAWIRYTMAETSLKELRDELFLAYSLEKSLWAPAPEPSLEQTKHALSSLQNFLTKANQVVRDETDQWKSEFQSALAQVEDYTKIQPKKVEESVVTIKIANPDRLAGAWSVSLNNGPDLPGASDSKTFRVTPGLVTIRLEALVKSGTNDASTKTFSTERGEVLKAAASTEVLITLPPAGS